MSSRLNIFSPQSFGKFGDLLRYLRERAELTQRDLASQVGYHYSYVSRIEKNEHIPDAATLVGRFIPALGLEREPQWTERLLKLAAETVQANLISKTTWLSAASHPALETTLPNFESTLNPLPVNLTALLGRGREIDQLTALISQVGVRLVTLVGPPGVGKTRLAVDVAAQLTGSFAHGAVFVDLTAAGNPRDVLHILTGALGLSEASELQPLARAINFLRQKSILLVMDNFEHVLEASPQLVQILSASPHIKMLVTSREALHVAGENQFNVEPLSLAVHSEAFLNEAPAIQLFVQRAQAVQNGFQLTNENVQAVAEICRRLDGLPLAIELAAPRIRMLSPQAMLAQFDRRLDWATRGNRDAQASRQTLRGALEWSYNLLSENRQVFFRRLSVFSGGWTVEAAEAICTDHDNTESAGAVQRGEILELLMTLADQSLVVVESMEGQARFRFLETIHAFARERLAQSAEAVEVKNRHLAYFTAFTEEVEIQVEGIDQIPWMRRAEQELNNIRAALDWGLQPEASFHDGLRLAGAISIYFISRSYFREGYERMQTYLSRIVDPAHERLKAKILYRFGALAGYCLEYPLAIQLCQQSIEISRSLNEKYYIASADYYLGDIYFIMGAYQSAQIPFEECISICRAENYMPQLSIALNRLGYILAVRGERERAQSMLDGAIKIVEEHNDTWGICLGLLSLGNAHYHWGNYDEAINCLTRCLDAAIPYGDRSSEGTAYITLAILYSLKNDYANSGDYAGRAFAVFQNIGDEIQQPLSLRLMSYAAIHAGNLVRARVLIRESLLGNQRLGDIPGQLAGLTAFAQCYLVDDDAKRAVELCALIERHMDQDGVSLPDTDMQILQDVLQNGREKLKADYDATYNEGGSLNLENEIMKLVMD